MNNEKFKTAFKFAIKNNINLIIEGAPGIGKSQSCEAICSEENDWVFYSNPVPLMTPATVAGNRVPDLKAKTVELLYNSFLKKVMNAKKQTVFLFEDLAQADSMIAKQLQSLIHLREVDGVKIPDCVSFVMDTNNASHRAGATTILSTVTNRSTVIQFPHDVDGWLKWGLSSGRICKQVLLFIHAYKGHLFPPAKIPAGMTPFNSPRAWERVSQWVEGGFTDLEILEGNLCKETAVLFSTFLQQLADFGNLIAKIKTDPNTAPIFEDDFSKIYGSVYMLANSLTKETVDCFIQYIKRYNNEELISVLLSIGCDINPDVKETKAYVSYITEGGK